MHLVLDASTAIDWFVVTDEGEAYSRSLTRLVAAGEVRFSVPLHFDVEVTGHLVKKHRRHPREFSKTWLHEALETLDALRLDIVGTLNYHSARPPGFLQILAGWRSPAFGQAGHRANSRSANS